MRTLLDTLRAWRAHHAAIRDLQGFSDLQLRDLGITRDQIEDYVAGQICQARCHPPADVIDFPVARICCQPPVCCAA